MTTITIAQYMALPEGERPQVMYNDDMVEDVYRDPTYRNDERYVIRFDTYGYGSKRPETELEVVEQ